MCLQRRRFSRLSHRRAWPPSNRPTRGVDKAAPCRLRSWPGPEGRLGSTGLRSMKAEVRARSFKYNHTVESCRIPDASSLLFFRLFPSFFFSFLLFFFSFLFFFSSLLFPMFFPSFPPPSPHAFNFFFILSLWPQKSYIQPAFSQEEKAYHGILITH